jgi:hypothetical protein
MAGVEGENLINAKADVVLCHRDNSITVVDFKTIAIDSDSIDDAALNAFVQSLDTQSR